MNKKLGRPLRELPNRICEECNTEFQVKGTHRTRKLRFCSRKCQGKYLSRKTLDQTEVICVECGKSFLRIKCKVKEKNYCSHKCYRDTRLKELNERTAFKRVNSCRSWKIRLRTTNGTKCEGCGDPRQFVLVVHHKDGNREHNIADNFEVLCPTCHVLRHLRLIETGWIYDSKSLTPRNKLQELTIRLLTLTTAPATIIGNHG